MRNLILLLIGILGFVSISGCATTGQKKIKEVFNTNEEEDLTDAATALESVTEAISGKKITAENARELSKDLMTNEDTQEAVKKIADSFDKEKVRVKYSPVTGKRYSADMDIDPETGVKLLPVE